MWGLFVFIMTARGPLEIWLNQLPSVSTLIKLTFFFWPFYIMRSKQTYHAVWLRFVKVSPTKLKSVTFKPFTLTFSFCHKVGFVKCNLIMHINKWHSTYGSPKLRIQMQIHLYMYTDELCKPFTECSLCQFNSRLLNLFAWQSLSFVLKYIS